MGTCSLGGPRAVANAMSCVAILSWGCVALVVGGPRHALRRHRCVTARGSVGVRLWLFYKGEEFGCRSTSAAAAAWPATSRGRGASAAACYARGFALVVLLPLAERRRVEKSLLQAACGARLLAGSTAETLSRPLAAPAL